MTAAVVAGMDAVPGFELVISLALVGTALGVLFGVLTRTGRG